MTVNNSAGPQYQLSFAYDDENELVAAWASAVGGTVLPMMVFCGNELSGITVGAAARWVKTNEVRYVYDGMLVVQERDQNNLPVVTYTRGSDLSSSLQGAGGIGGLLARTENSKLLISDPFASAYYFSDANENVVALVYTNGLLAAQYNYGPFGNMLWMSGPLAGPNKIRFSSKEWEENPQMYYCGYRYYIPDLARWPNRDPLEDLGGLAYLLLSLGQDDDESDGCGFLFHALPCGLAPTCQPAFFTPQPSSLWDSREP